MITGHVHVPDGKTLPDDAFRTFIGRPVTGSFPRVVTNDDGTSRGDLVTVDATVAQVWNNGHQVDIDFDATVPDGVDADQVAAHFVLELAYQGGVEELAKAT